MERARRSPARLTCAAQVLDEFGGPGAHALDFQQFGLLLAALDARDIAALETPDATTLVSVTDMSRQYTKPPR